MDVAAVPLGRDSPFYRGAGGTTVPAALEPPVGEIRAGLWTSVRLLAARAEVCRQIARLDKRVLALARDNTQCRRFMGVPGVLRPGKTFWPLFTKAWRGRRCCWSGKRKKLVSASTGRSLREQRSTGATIRYSNYGLPYFRFGSRLFSNSGLDVKLSVMHLPGSLFSPQ